MKLALLPAIRPVPFSEHAQSIDMAWYENDVPSFVESEIERIYGSLFSSLPHLRYMGKLSARTSTYVRRVDGKATSLLLFDRIDRQLVVLNELICLSTSELATFVSLALARYPAISIIELNAVRMDSKMLPYPSQRYFCSEDIVIPALSSLEAYAARLAKSTRKSIRNHSKALQHAHPSCTFTVLPANAVDIRLVHQIVEFNRARMSNKEKVSAYTNGELQWIAAMACARGFAVTITIAGQICAGSICCNIGGKYFLLVTSHDPQYDQFGLGMLCRYRMISECIQGHGEEIHFLWGRLAYKTSLSGVPQRFDRIAVYRDRSAYLRHLDKVASNAVSGLLREARLHLLDVENQPTVEGWIASKIWRGARWAKRTVNARRRRTS